jgi:flagellar protein FliL
MPTEPAIPVKHTRSISTALLLLLLLTVLISVAGGAFLAYTYLQYRQEPSSGAAGQTADSRTQQKTTGEMYALEPFVLNLSDPRGKRYLKVRIELELSSSGAVDRASRINPKLRDMVIMMLTSLTFEDIMTPEGKLRVRDELLQRFNQLLRPDRVLNLYFTEFVIQ